MRQWFHEVRYEIIRLIKNKDEILFTTSEIHDSWINFDDCKIESRVISKFSKNLFSWESNYDETSSPFEYTWVKLLSFVNDC